MGVKGVKNIQISKKLNTISYLVLINLLFLFSFQNSNSQSITTFNFNANSTFKTFERQTTNPFFNTNISTSLSCTNTWYSEVVNKDFKKEDQQKLYQKNAGVKETMSVNTNRKVRWTLEFGSKTFFSSIIDYKSILIYKV